MVADRTVTHINDVTAEEVYVAQRDPMAASAGALGGIRTLLGVPLLNKSEMIGAFFLSRQEVRPFTDKQIALVQSFAAQAVIAIENARLLNVLRQRTDDLTEALEQQTATSEVLKTISASPGDLQPVFANLLENAVRICNASFGVLPLYEGEHFRVVAMHNAPLAYADLRRRQPVFRTERMMRLATSKQPFQVADLLADDYRDNSFDARAFAELTGARTILAVPLLKEDQLVGAIVIYRREVRLFSQKQVELVENFAAQAVVAIENARLLNELRHSLEQQTATSEVLGVISRSRFELQPVLQSVVDTAARLCRAKTSGVFRLEGGGYRLATASGLFDPAYFEIEQQALISPGPGTLVGRAAMNRQVVQIEDAWSDPLYEQKENAKLGGVRSMIGVPLMREGEPIGVLGLARTQVEPFVEREVELVRTFADQAVIAIENARLLNELRERTDQLQAQSKELAELNQQLEHRVADQVGEIERMSRLRRFLPPQVADLIVASGSEKQLESHRREITALFCDLRGFTGFTESADAEDVMALLRDYHAAIGEIIIKYNGTLERYAGDGVMVVFNDPVPVENPALQAVLMALKLRGALGALTTTWSRLGHEIGFGIGIAHGFATLGTIGYEGRFDYAAIGTVSNVASRLCDEAKPGQILISARVLTKVENAVTVEPVGEFELKGIRRPLAAYNVVAAVS
jgi:GAF domain-containing protein